MACDLDFEIENPDPDVNGPLFSFPSWCVHRINGVGVTGSNPNDIINSLIDNAESVILDRWLNVIGMACAQPFGSTAFGSASEIDGQPVSGSNYFCMIYFVELTNDLTADNCLCAARDCCPTNLSLV